MRNSSSVALNQLKNSPPMSFLVAFSFFLSLASLSYSCLWIYLSDELRGGWICVEGGSKQRKQPAMKERIFFHHEDGENGWNLKQFQKWLQFVMNFILLFSSSVYTRCCCCHLFASNHQVELIFMSVERKFLFSFSKNIKLAHLWMR